MPTLRLPRITLFLALLLFFIVPTVPCFRMRLEGVTEHTYYLREAWHGFWQIVTGIISGSIPASDGASFVAYIFLFAAITFLLLVLPFLVTLLHRARPFLWIARFILIFSLGFFIVSHIRILMRLAAPDSVSAGFQVDFLSGYWLLLASVLLSTLGLFLIPRLTPKVARS